MKNKALYITLIVTIILLTAALLGLTIVKNKDDNTLFYARVIETFSSGAIIKPIDNELQDKYDVLMVDIKELEKNDLIKVKISALSSDSYPLKAEVKSYEIVDRAGKETTSVNNNDNINEDETAKITTTTSNKTTTTKGATNLATTKKVQTTTKKIEITTQSSPDDNVINTLENDIDLVNKSADDKSFKEKAKETFIKYVDFIFYDKDINGIYFKDLTSSAKLKIISLTLKLDNLIEKYFPGYKEDLSSAYNNAKTTLVKLYLDETAKYCANNDKVCKQAKSDFQDLKKSLNLTWDVIKSLTDAGVSKLKEWYEIYSGK